MKDYNKLLYIDNIPWKQKLNLNKIKKFSDIKYGDKIILHIDYLNVVFHSQRSQRVQDIVPVINISLRIREVIKQLYPYNEIFIIIYINPINLNCIFKPSTIQSIIDIIPNIALVDISNSDYLSDLKYFNDFSYKHIFYKNIKKDIKDVLNKNFQNWYISQGKIIVRS